MVGNSSALATHQFQTVELFAWNTSSALIRQFSQSQTSHRVGRQFDLASVAHGHDARGHPIQKASVSEQREPPDDRLALRLLPRLAIFQLLAIICEHSFGIVVERIAAAGAADPIGLALVTHFDRPRSAGDDAFRAGLI